MPKNPNNSPIRADTRPKKNVAACANGAAFKQTFQKLDHVLHIDSGCDTELSYTEQISWMLFLKYLDDLEAERKLLAQAKNITYQPILAGQYRWGQWAVPKDKDGKIDHVKAMTGDDLLQYVNNNLFPYLKDFKQQAPSPDTIEYKIGEIFGEIRNRIQDGYTLRAALTFVDALQFGMSKQRHELSMLYEDRIRNMGNAGRNGGEYYTPRPLIRAMIQAIDPKPGETIYDAAAGSAGFLCEAFDHLRSGTLSTKQLKFLQKQTFTGKEKKTLPYIIAIMNMILHGVEAPRIIKANALAENLSYLQEKDKGADIDNYCKCFFTHCFNRII